MQLTQSDADILSFVRAQVGSVSGERLGIAVSGGGDSVALMHILSRCFEAEDVQLFAATVDHGLRSESAGEALNVGKYAATLGIPHSVLRWSNWDGVGNLQDQARQARYQLLVDWANSNNISTLMLGHTADDQAETVLMRLGRSAGVDGLAGIPSQRVIDGVTFLRPMMGLSREQLRDYLTRHDVKWVEDPSNDDSKYDRIKARQMLDLLRPLGITSDSLSDVAQNMASARAALDQYSFQAAQEIASVVDGNVVLDPQKFRLLPEETARRLFVSTISWISGASYPPRRAPVLKALDALREKRAATLSGCHVLPYKKNMWVCREFNAVRELDCESGQVWDRRWRLKNASFDKCVLRALGQNGLRHCPNWRDMGRPEAALTASPSVWKDGELLAAPFAGLNDDCEFELVDGGKGFFSSILTH